MEADMPENDDKTVVTASRKKVDESLPTGGGPSRFTANQQRELEQLRAELRRLQGAVSRPSPARSLTSPSGPRSVREEVEYQIRLKPIASVALAAVVGFVYGIAR
jgi:ElaB/YqjD/DUF883 family membrane-anchored ribosome-binding protein